MTFFHKHIFFCINQRNEGKTSCANSDSTYFYNYAKKKYVLSNRGKAIRISHSGCLGQCIKGPVLVIYPDTTWYTYQTSEDIDEIIESDVFHDIKVERLLLK